MPPLHLALQNGFMGEAVVIRVNDREVFRDVAVETRMQIGLAAEHHVDVPTGVARIEVELPGRGASTTFEIPVSVATYLGISLRRDGTIEHVVSDQPFGYV